MYSEIILLTVGAADTTKERKYWSVPIQRTYLTHSFEIAIPAWTDGAPTITFEIISASGASIYSVSGLAESTIHLITIERAITYGAKVKITLTAAPGGSGGVVSITSHIDAGTYNAEVARQLHITTNLTVDGKILLSDGSAAAPSLSFANDTDTGILLGGSGLILFSMNGAGNWEFGASYAILWGNDISIRLNNDVFLQRDAAAILALRNTTNPQTFKIYETYTDASNYERYAFIASGNQLEIKAETAGTGVDDLDIALTPAGAGNVKFGTYGAIVAETLQGYVTIKDSSGNLRKVAVVA